MNADGPEIPRSPRPAAAARDRHGAGERTLPAVRRGLRQPAGGSIVPGDAAGLRVDPGPVLLAIQRRRRHRLWDRYVRRVPVRGRSRIGLGGRRFAADARGGGREERRQPGEIPVPGHAAVGPAAGRRPDHLPVRGAQLPDDHRRPAPGLRILRPCPGAGRCRHLRRDHPAADRFGRASSGGSAPIAVRFGDGAHHLRPAPATNES